MWNDAEPLIVQNLIAGNQASEGGGIHSAAATGAIINNTIADNDSLFEGSGIFMFGYQGLQLINNIIVAKPGQVSLRCNGMSPPNARFNNVFSAGAPAYAGSCSALGGTNANISADPLFANPIQGDYHLQQGSPSIDAGDSQAPNLPDTDIDGNPRILDGDGDGTATIDMGIDEFLLPPGFKISLLDESNRNSKNSRSLFICDLRPWARTPGRRPNNTLSALPPRSPRLRIK
jgi:hypothetical protein